MFMYGFETRALRKADEWRTSIVKIRFMRRSVGYIFMDRKRNEEILNERKVTSAIKKIKQFPHKTIPQTCG